MRELKDKLHLLKMGLFAWLIFCFSASLSAQRISTIDSWTGYPSHNFIREIVRIDDVFYGISKGGLFSYNIKNGHSASYTTVEGLSQTDPTAIYHDARTGKTILGFLDGMINIFEDPADGFDYISDIQRSELFTVKTINGLTSFEEKLFIATEFGIVVFDLDKLETRSTVSKIGSNPSGSAVYDINVIGDSLMVAMGSNGIWRVSVQQENISTPTVWTEVTGKNGLPRGNCKFLAKTNQETFAQVSDSIFRRTGNGAWTMAPFPHRPYSNLRGFGNYLIAMHDKTAEVLRPTGGIIYANGKGRMLSAYADSSIVLIGDTVNGLSIWYANDSTTKVSPVGPYNNLVTRMAVGNREFYIAPEGQGGSTAPAGNTDGFWHFNPFKGWHRFEVEDELPRDSVWAEFGRCYYSLEDSVCYMGSWNHGIIRLQAGEITDVWTPKNSMLNGGVGNNVRISGLALDDSKVLWATAIVADYQINALDTDGNWYNYEIPGAYPSELLIDNWGNKWIINYGVGIVVFNENGTLNVSTDDKVKFLGTETGRGGLPNGNVYTLAKDLKGQIWVGTLEGVVVFANPSAVFNTNFPDASCPSVEGFCLLRDQKINSIAVDGANRKWIGTENGIYLVNPQGNQQIAHYTTENSPLFTNEIREIKIDQETGEIFIGTNKGTLSLMGEAIGGKDDSEDLYVFPNPIPVNFDGPIAITCSYKDVEVKITTVSGRLVKTLTALGGQAIWDGNDMSGNRVTPGVYLAMVADKEGQNAGIAKFVILEESR